MHAAAPLADRSRQCSGNATVDVLSEAVRLSWWTVVCSLMLKHSASTSRSLEKFWESIVSLQLSSHAVKISGLRTECLVVGSFVT